MTDTPAIPTPATPALPKPTRSTAGWLFLSAFTMLVSSLFLAAAPAAWLLVQKYPNLRTLCCIIAILAGLSSAFILALAMHFLDRPTQDAFKPWYIRSMLATAKRIILILQLLTTALALAAAAVLVFDFGIPGT